MPGASAAAIGRTSNINDPVWATQWLRRFDESLPISTGPWCKNLHTLRATVLLGRFPDVQASLTLDQETWGIPAGQLHLLAQASARASCLWPQRDLSHLAIVGLGVVVAVAIVPSHGILALWCAPQVQIAIGMIISIWFIVPGAAKPPRRIIGGHP